MSKLSESLKALINASHARPGTVAPPKQIASVYERISREAASKNVGFAAWLSASTAATMTMNSPGSLLELHRLATSSTSKAQSVYAAELMREVGLKCIGFNGVPRTINCLGAFYSGLPSDISSALSKQPTRSLNSGNITSALDRGQSLWKSIYFPFDEKLSGKLSQSHPDLPVHIIESEYGCLFSDPPAQGTRPAKVGRVLTSIVAVACLRAQTGVGPQVTSHVFGLRKAFEDGSYKADGEDEVEGGEWLASNEGSTWLLQSVDRIVEVIGGGMGTSFAPGLKAKL